MTCSRLEDKTGDPRFNIPWTNAGCPAITLPAALNGAGLLLGVQLAGAPGTDLHLLRVARHVEERLGWGKRAPSFLESSSKPLLKKI